MSECCDGRGVNARSASDGWQERAVEEVDKRLGRTFRHFHLNRDPWTMLSPLSLLVSLASKQLTIFYLPRPRFQFRIKAKQHEGRHNPITNISSRTLIKE